MRHKEGSSREVKIGGNEKGESREGETDHELATPMKEARDIYFVEKGRFKVPSHRSFVLVTNCCSA